MNTLSTLQQVQKFKKANDLSVICFCALADPACKTFFSALGQIKEILSQENTNVEVAFADVDEITDGDVVTPFKIHAIPTTIFFRKEAGETGRVEGMNIEKLRSTVASHLISTTAMAPSASSNTHHKHHHEHHDDAAEKRSDKKSNDINVINAYFGNLDAGVFVDVTNKIRSILDNASTHKHCVIRADKAFLDCPSTFTNTENNKLRIVVEKSGAGRTFSVIEGKEIDFGEALDFHFVQHSGRDEYDAKHANVTDDGDFTNGANPYGGVPQLPKEDCRR